ncbi:MAG: protease inhibitor I42 family protein [Chloroflexota bacterium]
MIRKILFLGALLFSVVLTTGCGPTQTQLVAADNGKTLKVKTGDQIVIMLEGNPSTGYTWEAKDLDVGTFQQVGETQFKSSSPGSTGAGGTLTLTFKALRAGTSTLALIYHRPWETDVEPQSTFAVTVTVK